MPAPYHDAREGIIPNDMGGVDIILRPTLQAPAMTDRAVTPQPGVQQPAGVGDVVGGVFNGGGGETARLPRPRPQQPQDVHGTLGTHDNPPDMGGILPGGVGDYLAAVAGGASKVDRYSSPITALAQGFSGAVSVRDQRRKDKRAEMIEDEDRQFAREEHGWAREEHDWSMDERGFQRGRQERADERAEKTFDWEEVSQAAGIKLTMAKIKQAEYEIDQLATTHGLTAEEINKAESRVARIMEMKWGKDNPVSDDPEAEAAYDTMYRRTREEVYRQFGSRGAGSTPGATVGGYGGKGTSPQDPISWAPGSEPKSDEEYLQQLDAALAANGGNPIHVRNPATGQVGTYSGRR